MLAREIMTTDVVTVRLGTPVREIAALLSKRQFSGVPVAHEDGRLLGIVSESDLIHHAAIKAEPKGKWWLDSLSDPDAIAAAYAKSHGRTAADVMARHVATIADDATLEDVAEVLGTHNIKRVPVMREGRLVGIITRSDLVRALAKAKSDQVAAPLGNAAVQKAILQGMAEQLWLDASYVNVLVKDHVIELRGYIASTDQRHALQVLAGGIDQSRKINDELEIGLPIVSDFT